MHLALVIKECIAFISSVFCQNPESASLFEEQDQSIYLRRKVLTPQINKALPGGNPKCA
jgi:hypothetical protein